MTNIKSSLVWGLVVDNSRLLLTIKLYIWGQRVASEEALQWCHNERDGVSNHQPHDCLLNRLFRHRSKKTSKLRVTGLCDGVHRWPDTGPMTRKMFPFDDGIMDNYFQPNWLSMFVILDSGAKVLVSQPLEILVSTWQVMMTSPWAPWNLVTSIVTITAYPCLGTGTVASVYEPRPRQPCTWQKDPSSTLVGGYWRGFHVVSNTMLCHYQTVRYYMTIYTTNNW